MPDLFSRLAARSRGEVTSLRPRPESIYTGTSLVVSDDTAQSAPSPAPPDATNRAANPPSPPPGVDATDPAVPTLAADATDRAANPANPPPAVDATDGLDTPDPGEGREPAGGSRPARRAPTPEEERDEWEARPSAPLRQEPPLADAAVVRTPGATTRDTAPSGDHRERSTARGMAAAGVSTLAQVVAALDAGSPVITPGVEGPSRGPLAPTPRAGPVHPDRGVRDHDRAPRERGHDVHVTIGELVIRGTPAAPPTHAAPAAAPPPARQLTLHDYLRGRREPT
jgi:hypothetical protein